MSTRGWIAFAACSVIWGVPYLFIKVAVDDGVPPVFVAWSRMVLGAAVLLVLGWRAGVLGQVRGRWHWLAVYAVIELAIPFPLIAIGEQHVSSSLAAILIASVPLFVALLALRFDHEERAEGRRLAGLVIGLGGVVALMGIDVAGRTEELLGALAVLVAAVGYAAGPMLLKRKLTGIDPRAAMAAALVVAAGVLTPLVAIDWPAQAPSFEGWASLVVLGVVCTALGLVVFAVLIHEVGPGRGLVITYVNPLVAVALGVTLLGERPGAGAVAGLLLILAGSWLATGGSGGSITGTPPGGPPEEGRGALRMRARRITAIVTAGMLAIGGVGACGEEDVEDAARDTGEAAEDVGNQAEDEAGEAVDEAEKELEE